MHIKRDLFLFLKNPKAYLYTFNEPDQGKIIVKPFSKKDLEFAKKLIQTIQKQVIGLSLVLVGSLALGIAGEGDIDMVGASSDWRIRQYISRISKILGPPDKVRADFIEWKTQVEGRKIELVIAQEKNPIVAGPIFSYGEIQKSPVLIKEYEKMKLAANGVTPREYRLRKMQFFLKNGIFR
jgi:hypothetical protein